MEVTVSTAARSHTLQFPIRSFNGFVAIHLLLCLLLLAIPSESAESLWQDWMGEVIARIHPVGVHSTQILDLQPDEGLCQFLWISKLDRKFV